MGKVGGVLIAIIIIIVVLVGSCIGTYNGLVSSRENVASKLSTIDVMLQRRADLTSQLVQTVQGQMNQEKEVIQMVTSAREKLAGVANSEASLSDKAKADDELTNALSRLLVVVENYPDIKSSQAFTTLMDQIEGSENRISVARKDYNDAVQEYNLKIQKFPGSIIAGMFNFTKADYFEATEKATEVPNIQFN